MDLRDALDALAGHGQRLPFGFFAPHLEFRFLLASSVTLSGTAIELRQALEPWPVLGEMPGVGGTVRHVDNSVERLEVRVDGWVAERCVLGCNGHAVPLTPTARVGEAVGGARFKAWKPIHGSHPVLPAQTPLVFAVFDRWSGRSSGGLTHHVAHPGGRNYETRPENPSEAEARRRARFRPFGHMPGAMGEPVPSPSPELP